MKNHKINAFIALMLSAVMLLASFGVSVFAETGSDSEDTHVHNWSLTKTGSNTATLKCLNEGCEYYGDGITLTLKAEDSSYDEDGYDTENNVMIESSGDLPEGSWDFLEAGTPVFRNALGKKVSAPKDSGLYWVSVTYSLNDSDDSVTLTDHFYIKKKGNVKYFGIIEGWTEGDEPNKPDTSWTVTGKPLVLYVPAEDTEKIAKILSSLENKESISLEDFKGIDISPVPPTEAGEYMVLVIGVSRNYVDVGIDLLVIEGRTGVLDVEIGDWTYGEYDPDMNGPVVRVDGEDVTEASVLKYKPLFSSYDEYEEFDTQTADYIDSGVYMLKARTEIEGESRTMVKLFTVKKAYCYTNEPMAVRGLTADGTEQQLVTEGTCENDDCWFMYSITTSPVRPITYTESVPSVTEAGTYYVWYIFCSENNNYYSYVSVFPLKVVVAEAEEAEPAAEAVEEEPAAEPEEEEVSEAVDSTVPSVGAFAIRKAKKALKVSWEKPDEDISYVEIMYSANKNFKKAKVAKASPERTKYKISKLKRKKKYFVKMRFVRIADGQKYTSAWTKAKKAKTR